LLQLKTKVISRVVAAFIMRSRHVSPAHQAPAVIGAREPRGLFWPKSPLCRVNFPFVGAAAHSGGQHPMTGQPWWVGHPVADRTPKRGKGTPATTLIYHTTCPRSPCPTAGPRTFRRLI